MRILSVPRLINGIEPFVEVFHTVREARPPAEEAIPAPDESFFVE